MWCGSQSTDAHPEPSWPPSQEATDLPAAAKEVPVAAEALAAEALADEALAAEALAAAECASAASAVKEEQAV